MKVELEDVTPDYTCYALQGPRSTEVLEALTGETLEGSAFFPFQKTITFESGRRWWHGKASPARSATSS